MTYVIGEPCIDVMDRACVEECPVDCIYEGGRSLYIHPDECVDCGACEPVCPVEAIYYRRRPTQQVGDIQRRQRTILHRPTARPRHAARLPRQRHQTRPPRCRHSPRHRASLARDVTTA